MKLPSLRPKELVKILYKQGCILKRQTGSHQIFYYPDKQKIIVVPMHPKNIKKGLLGTIIKELDLSSEEIKKS